MNIYKVYRTDEIGYDEYDAYVVIAEDKSEALNIADFGQTKSILVDLVGESLTSTSCIVLSSFHAG